MHQYEPPLFPLPTATITINNNNNNLYPRPWGLVRSLLPLPSPAPSPPSSLSTHPPFSLLFPLPLPFPLPSQLQLQLQSQSQLPSPSVLLLHQFRCCRRICEPWLPPPSLLPSRRPRCCSSICNQGMRLFTAPQSTMEEYRVFANRCHRRSRCHQLPLPSSLLLQSKLVRDAHGNFQPNSHRALTKKYNVRHFQGLPSGFFFRKIVGVKPPLLSLTIFLLSSILDEIVDWNQDGLYLWKYGMYVVTKQG